MKYDTSAELRTFLSGKLPQSAAFDMPSASKLASMLRADLADAHIPYVDESGRYADFHSLRHTTGSLLAASGVHPKVAQVIMRHSTVDLTMSRNSHVYRGQESEAVAGLPDLSPTSAGQAAMATGTDDVPVEPTGTYKPAYKKLAKRLARQVRDRHRMALGAERLIAKTTRSAATISHWERTT